MCFKRKCSLSLKKKKIAPYRDLTVYLDEANRLHVRFDKKIVCKRQSIAIVVILATIIVLMIMYYTRHFNVIMMQQPRIYI